MRDINVIGFKYRQNESEVVVKWILYVALDDLLLLLFKQGTTHLLNVQ